MNWAARLDALYVQAVAEVPQEVRDWAGQNVSLVNVPRSESTDWTLHGVCLPPGSDDLFPERWTICIATPTHPQNDTEELILHELAHAWLGHRGSWSDEEYDQHEFEVEAQVSAWRKTPEG